MNWRRVKTTEITRHEQAAKQKCDAMSRIIWEMDFRKLEESQFVPFLDTEIKIGPDGTLVTRKLQNKCIILHSRSLHPDLSQKLKVEIRNTTKLLGVTLDSKLSWNEHIN